MLYNQNLKFLLGIEQIWVNIELICSIRHCLKSALGSIPPSPARFIRGGRVLVLCFIVVYALTIFSLLRYCDATLDIEERHTVIKKGNNF